MLHFELGKTCCDFQGIQQEIKKKNCLVKKQGRHLGIGVE